MDSVWTRREEMEWGIKERKEGLGFNASKAGLQQSGFFTQIFPLLQTFREHPHSENKTKLCMLRRPHSNCPLTGPMTSMLPNTPQSQPHWAALLVNRLQMDLENVSRSQPCESDWAKGTGCTEAWRCETACRVPGLGEARGLG